MSPKPLACFVMALASALPCCSSDAPSPGDAAVDQAVADPGQEIGGFDIILVPATPATKDTPAVAAQTSLLGGVRSGAVPSPVVWEPTMTAGDCRLLVPRIPFCNPGCQAPALCVDGDRCAQGPTPRTAGTIGIKGLRSATGPLELTVPPEPPNFNYQLPAGVALAYPPFAPGATVELTGAGDLGAFTLTAAGISPLLPDHATVEVAASKPLALAWTRPAAGESGRIHIALDLSVHGGSKGRIDCDSADSGALTIPAAMVDGLRALGTAGFPSVVLTRQATGTAALAVGKVALKLISEVRWDVTIPGQVNCVETSDCPNGQTCQPNLLCR